MEPDNILNFKKNTKQDIVNNYKAQDLFQKALKKAKATGGIDYYKVITGDEKENHRLKMLQLQEKMNHHHYD